MRGGQTRKQRGAGRSSAKKSKSRSIRRPVDTMSFRKAAVSTPFSARIGANVLGKLYNKYKVTRKSGAPEMILRASVKVARAEATNLLILYRKLLVIKLYYSHDMAHLDAESNEIVISQLDLLRKEVLKSLKYIFNTGPVALKTIRDHKNELKDISDTYGIPTFKEILTELSNAAANNEMNGGVKAELQEEIEEDELGDELLGAFAALKVGNDDKKDKELDDAVADLFAGLKL